MKVVALIFACLTCSVRADDPFGGPKTEWDSHADKFLERIGQGAISDGGKEVTKETFWNMTANYENVFLKFCRAGLQRCVMANGMFGKWYRKYEGSNADVMLEVDCDGAGASLCHALGVFECKLASPFHAKIDTDHCNWFPIFKKGDPLNCTEDIRYHDCLQTHHEGPDPNALERAMFRPRPWCRPLSMEKCPPEKVEYWRKMWNTPVEKIEDLLRAEEMKLYDAEDTYKKTKKRLAADMKEAKKKGASKEELQVMKDEFSKAGRDLNDAKEEISFYGPMEDYKDLIKAKKKGKMHEMARSDWTAEKQQMLEKQMRDKRTRPEILEAEKVKAAKKLKEMADKEAKIKKQQAAKKKQNGGAEL